MGYQVDAEGLHTTAVKVKAIVDAPKPGNVKQLCSFLGLVNYYGRFVPNLATVAHPLNQLTRHQLRQCTERDKVLSKVMNYTLNGWPNQVEPVLKPFSNRQQELTVEAGCILWGSY